ncbi:MAG TPA: ribosome recycling factor [Candidatus Paceibacterota bacterium]
MYKDIINQRKKEFDQVFEFAKNEAASIRTGRANPSLVEDIQVEYMGSRLKIKELAGISTPESRVITIQPWDPQALAIIEKAIRESSLGLNPSVDGQVVRITLPSLTEERRKEFIKLLGQKMEEARIRARHIREDILKKVQHEVKEGKGREDDVRNTKDELQKLIDGLNKKIDEVAKKKEQELMTS